MKPLVNKLISLAEVVTKKPNINENTTLKQKDTSPLEINNEFYDHQVISIEEDEVNHKLRSKLRNHWFVHSITVEFEPNNKVFMSVITKLGQVINVEFDIEDVWFDDYTSTIALHLDVSNVDMGSWFLNTLVHIMGNWSLSLLGNFFNPFNLGTSESTVRFEKKGIIRFDLRQNSRIRDFVPWPKRSADSEGPIFLSDVKTNQSVLEIEYYAFHKSIDTYAVPDIPVKTNWVRSIDMLAVLLLPIGVWVTYIILHHYLPHETIEEISFTTYFMITLTILLFSVIVMNIPRYIYMYFETRKKWQSVFVSNNIKIQMRKLQRRIIMQKAELEVDQNLDVKARQERIMDMLVQIRDRRFLAQRLKIADEDRDRKQKVKFIIAYVICTLLEWILLMR